ncbi:hypothetical protein ACQ859_13310 [Roseateles chitinivorans]|uniref:hypothetical protein n=1 Tax=Roseateles chitinivorans TaxID=2917965 RepID=UPI003D66FB41
MHFDIKCQSLISVLHGQTLARKVQWQKPADAPAGKGEDRSALRYEATYRQARFALYQQDGLQRNPSTGMDGSSMWFVLAILDEQDSEFWREVDSNGSVSRLYRLVQRRATPIDQIYAAIVDPVYEQLDREAAEYRRENSGWRASLRRFKRTFVARFMSVSSARA